MIFNKVFLRNFSLRCCIYFLNGNEMSKSEAKHFYIYLFLHFLFLNEMHRFLPEVRQFIVLAM